MSKSRGNVIAPDVLVDKYGADTVRAYIMFYARWEMGAPWDSHEGVLIDVDTPEALAALEVQGGGGRSRTS